MPKQETWDEWVLVKLQPETSSSRACGLQVLRARPPAKKPRVAPRPTHLPPEGLCHTRHCEPRKQNSTHTHTHAHTFCPLCFTRIIMPLGSLKSQHCSRPSQENLLFLSCHGFPERTDCSRVFCETVGEGLSPGSGMQQPQKDGSLLLLS